MLTVSDGTWLPVTLAYRYSYAWQRCNGNGRVCVPIPGATSASYAVAAADIGHALAAVVTATTGSTSQVAFSIAAPVA